MLEFLPLVESMEKEKASVAKLFSGEGQRSETRRGAATPKYMELLVEAAELYAAVVNGKKPGHYLTEAMTTSDFPVLFGDILDRQILANYQNVPSNWQQWIKRRTARDFRLLEYRFRPEGEVAESRLERVHEQEEYPETNIGDLSKIQYRIGKFGRRLPISWESLINDDIDYFADIPRKFGVAAARTEAREAIGLFLNAAGPISPFFSVGNDNVISGAGSALSIASLQTALTKFANLKDDAGEPIYVEAAILVVPPALEIVAQNILNATQIEMVGASVGMGDLGTPGASRVQVANWLRNRVKVVVEPYLPIINESADADTTWFLFASPNSGRPAGEMAFLRGHESPEVFIKSPNAMRVGGGQVNPLDGDFDTDSIEYKVRHVLGGTRIEPRAAVVSLGDG